MSNNATLKVTAVAILRRLCFNCCPCSQNSIFLCSGSKLWMRIRFHCLDFHCACAKWTPRSIRTRICVTFTPISAAEHSFQSQHVLPRHPASVVLRVSSSSERCFIAHGIIVEFTEAHNLALTNHADSGRRPNLSATCRAVCHNVSSLKPEGYI